MTDLKLRMDSPYKVSYDHSIQHFALSAIIKEKLAIKREFPYLVNNFLMRYPDSFGQRTRQLGNDLIYNIFKFQLNLNSGCGDIATQSFYHIRAYRENPPIKLAQNH